MEQPASGVNQDLYSKLEIEGLIQRFEYSYYPLLNECLVKLES